MIATFSSAHKGVESSGKPSRHQPKLYRNCSDASICQTLRIVLWQPADDGELLKNVLCCRSGKGSASLLCEINTFMPGNIGLERVLGSLNVLRHAGFLTRNTMATCLRKLTFRETGEDYADQRSDIDMRIMRLRHAWQYAYDVRSCGTNSNQD